MSAISVETGPHGILIQPFHSTCKAGYLIGNRVAPFIGAMHLLGYNQFTTPSIRNGQE